MSSEHTLEVSFALDEMLRLAERIRRLWLTANDESYPGPGWFTFDSALQQDYRDLGDPAVSWILEGIVRTELWPNLVDVPARYASPEYLDNQPSTVQSDIFGIGIHGYIMVSGRDPFLRNAESVLAAMTHRIMGPYPDVRDHRKACPRALSSLIMKCIAPDLPSRYVSIDEIIDELAVVKEKLLSTV